MHRANKFGSMPAHVLPCSFRKVAPNHIPESSCQSQAAVALTASGRAVKFRSAHRACSFIYKHTLIRLYVHGA